jgi:hypothetical protein
VIGALEVAITQLQEMCGMPQPGAEGMGPPDTPFPEEPEAVPTPNSRYAAAPYAMDGRQYNAHTPSPYAQQMHARQRNVHPGARYSNPQQRYQFPEAPVQYGQQYYEQPYAEPAPAAPIPYGRGERVTYDRIIGQQNYRLQQLEQQNQLLMYERDSADTMACEAEISRLASMGYMVDEYEVNELKRKPIQERAGFIAYIMNRYQKIGTEPLPPVLGDPTPGPAPDLNYPMTRQEMQQVLQMTGGNSSPQIYKQAVAAVMYQRGQQGQQQQPGVVNRLPLQYQAVAPPPPPGMYPPQGGYPNPYGAPDAGTTPYGQYASPDYAHVPTQYGAAPQPAFDPNSYVPPAGSILNGNPFTRDGFAQQDQYGTPNSNEGW